MVLKTLDKLKKGLLWSIGLYQMDDPFDFDKNLIEAKKVFNYKKIRIKKERVHTNADPFLFVKDDFVYLFYESQSIRKPGIIKAYKTADLKNFIDLGVILKEDFHLSYPFIFEMNGSVFMMPDGHGAGEIRLYKFENFPYRLKLCKVLLKGNYLDPSVIMINGLWFLFATSEKGLKIFFTEDLENQPLEPHPQNPISTDPRYQRCGGGVVLINNQHYRLAQDCSEEYGKNLHIFKINSIDTKNYREELFKENYLLGLEKWNYLGGHHLSFVRFRGKSVIATDGKHLDYFVNKLGTFFHKVKIQLNL